MTIRSTDILSLTLMLLVSPTLAEAELLRTAPSRRAIPRAQDPTRCSQNGSKEVTSRPGESRFAVLANGHDRQRRDNPAHGKMGVGTR
jgi:hypothetical protein